MIRTILIPLLAIVGVIFGVVTVIKNSKPPPVALPVVEPARAPFPSFVAGSGLIEASSQNIAIGNPVAGTIATVRVAVGDSVKKGEVLFELDSRDLRAQLGVAEANLAASESQVKRLKTQPRPEEVPPAEAKVAAARAVLSDAESQLAMWEKVPDKRALSEDQLSQRRFAVEAARARLADAEAQLTLLKAGAWAPDVAVAEAQAASARAAVDSVKTELDRRMVRAPVDGQVLQVNVRPGEFAPAGVTQTPLMLFGTVTPLHVRVDVDEHEAYRVKAGAKAMAFLRGRKEINTELKFVRFEPYVVPKRSLTGESTERVDTRVLQVIYAFDRGSLPVYVGQQMDVYVEAEPVENTAAAPTPGAKK